MKQFSLRALGGAEVSLNRSSAGRPFFRSST